MLKNSFIKATNDYTTFEKSVPAPYIRKSFTIDTDATAKITVAACGFYELYINGKRYTKGYLAPYISNPDDYIYYDNYEVKIDKGENVIAFLLGNGFQNNPSGYIWDFDKASFRSAPLVSCQVSYKNAFGKECSIFSDSTFKVAPSPIRRDDYRFGEHYDANFEIAGWNDKGFDDTKWNNVIVTKAPKGELRLCAAEPIVKECELKPVKITKEDDGYVYDFGVNNSGFCKLNVSGYKGQKIVLTYGEMIADGKFTVDNIWFHTEYEERDYKLAHKDVYVCKGDECEVYTPSFTYHGFRYVKVTGITEAQATDDLLTYFVIHSDIKSRGGFKCSDDTINTLQEMVRRSDISNFHYFPTDCPHREKNGWTADAALSTEQMLLNFTPEISFREWLINICKAQNEEGEIPGIIPTSGWGFGGWNGPAWDCIVAYLPYYVYIYRGETDMIKESAQTIYKYLKYLLTRKDENGLMHIGLGDWCHVNGVRPPKAPLEVTDTVMSFDIATKAAFMFNVIGLEEWRDFALKIAQDFKTAIRENLIDFNSFTVKGNCQTSQAMCIFYNVFNDDEKARAFEVLLKLIHNENDHFDVGVLGARVIFHVLSDFGYSDLAYKMITTPEFPSYKNLIDRGATTLWENFFNPEYKALNNCDKSLNHHFWGDISSWFIKQLAGIQFNPNGDDITRLNIKPSFVKVIQNAEGYYTAPSGKIVSSWVRKGDDILLSLLIPESITATAILPSGYTFDDGNNTKQVTSGNYKIISK